MSSLRGGSFFWWKYFVVAGDGGIFYMPWMEPRTREIWRRNLSQSLHMSLEDFFNPLGTGLGDTLHQLNISRVQRDNLVAAVALRKSICDEEGVSMTIVATRSTWTTRAPLMMAQATLMALAVIWMVQVTRALPQVAGQEAIDGMQVD